MRQTKNLSRLLIGALISLLGLISFLLQGRAFKDLKFGYEFGSGYLFVIAGLVVIFISALFLFSEKKPEGKETDQDR